MFDPRILMSGTAHRQIRSGRADIRAGSVIANKIIVRRRGVASLLPQDEVESAIFADVSRRRSPQSPASPCPNWE
jgi:hypothetical protein